MSQPPKPASCGSWTVRSTTCILATGTALLLMSIDPAEARSARADALEIDDKDRATLAKETLKQRRSGNDRQGGRKPGADEQCGNVDIGNSAEDRKGSNRIAERNKTVIVTGNVYNTAKCR